MDIFDLNLEEFEREVDNLLNNVSEDEFLQELIDNGLIIDEYEKYSVYDTEEDLENTWIHIDCTSPLKKFVNMISKKSTSSFEEAA